MKGPVSPEVTDFVAKARAFCSFVLDAASYEPDARLLRAAQLLTDLYGASLRLPTAEPRSDSIEPEVELPAFAGFEQHGCYWEVFDPYEMNDDAVVCGSLTDDFLDIFRDVMTGLMMFDSGDPESAVWHWRFSRGIHWGDHAVDALRALQRALMR